VRIPSQKAYCKEKALFSGCEKMRIALIGEPWLMPPYYYGGAERILHLLGQGLAKRGHTVHLIAGDGSSGYGGRFISYENQGKSLASRAFRRIDFSLKTLCLSRDVDIVHSFKFWPNYHVVVNNIGKPVIYTQQNTSRPDDLLSIIRANNKNGYMQGVSRSQVHDLIVPDSSRLFVVHNAVDVGAIQPVSNPSRDYLAYLGRLNYDKGIDIAVQLSLQIGIPLKIAGVIRPAESDAALLFEKEVKPFLGNHIEFIGPIDDSQKSQFLGNALALLMPNRWREPFGIVMAEALSAGTPVIGTNLGSIPELIEDGRTGFVCNSFADLLNSILKVDKIKPHECREEALAKYSEQVYLDNMLEMYRKILAR